MNAFNAIRLSPKWQTIVASLMPAGKPPESKHAFLRLEDGDHLKLLYTWPPQGQLKLVVLFHGLCGSSESNYMVRLSRKLYQRHIPVVRVNHRGATPELIQYAKHIYHAGKSQDVYAVLHHLHTEFPEYQLIPIGFSISGNMLLKALGQLPKDLNIAHAYAMCPAVDLTTSAQRLKQTTNRLFQHYFIKKIKKMIRLRYQYHADLGPMPAVEHIKTLYDLDHVYAAPEAGYRHVDAYYQHASALPYLNKIQVACTIVADVDDPFIANDVLINQDFHNLTIQLTHQGGHMGYLAKTKGWGFYQYWMDAYLVDAIECL